MTGYWSRHRLLLSVILCVATAIVAGLLFAFPYITQQASDYNEQSIYKNSEMDFIAPEPSYEQVVELAGTNGIDKVFPFYLTKTQVTVNGTSRTGTVLLSDNFQNIDITMYNDERLIEKAAEEPAAPILVDWQFCHDTGATIGDKVSFTINGAVSEFEIFAIYETNSIYDGGAIIAQISAEQADGIKNNSKNGGYSGMYIAASDYNTCRTYLTTDYRPLGRLKDRVSFESDEQYQIHYDAIMSAGYANEITDFRVRENAADKASGDIMIWLGAALAMVLIVAFNVVMAKRGCEKVYFAKHCIPKGQDVKPYYKVAFMFETILQIILFAGVILIMLNTADTYIPKEAMDIKLVVIPAAMIVAEIICLAANNSRIVKITKEVKRID